MSYKIDFHCHSTASDGTFTPAELVAEADKEEVSFLALTDHDTTDGIDEFMATEGKVNKIAGIELSVDNVGGELHIVGLFVDKNNKELKQLEKDVKKYRKDRNDSMVKKLSTLLKREIKLSDLIKDTNAQLGRPHIAKYMLRNGIVATRQEAFDKYLGSNGILNVQKERVTIERAISAIKSAGGISILAHPSTLNLTDFNLDVTIKAYKNKGLDGIEAFSSNNLQEKCSYYCKLAKKYDLAISCGSDFHGGNSTVLTVGANIVNVDPLTIVDNLYKLANKSY